MRPASVGHLCIARRLAACEIVLLIALMFGLFGASLAQTGLSSLSGPTTTTGRSGPVVQTPEARTELVVHAPQGFAPGREMWLGLQIDHAPEWHTYWKNPGDSGLPTTLEWTLPPGWSAGEIDWPAPHGLPVGPLLNFGYEGRLVLPVPLTLSETAARGPVTLRLKANWLICRIECIPQSGEFELALNSSDAAYSPHAAAFAASLAARPMPHAGGVSARLLEDARRVGFTIEGLPADWHDLPLQGYPEQLGVFEHARPATWQWGTDGQLQLSLAVSEFRTEGPTELALVLRGGPDGQQTRRVVAALSGSWPALDEPSATQQAAALALSTVSADPGLGFWAALAAALIGGLILNLMPCVFPVLAIKVGGFATLGSNLSVLRRHGWFYALGVIGSFVLLAGLLLMLRAGGEQLGWGFQLQQPWFVAALALLFTLIALNLAGWFELGNFLPQRWLQAQARHPDADALLSGLLAVAVASPCTAPFMGAALGAALGMPAAQTLIIFAALGLGLALPYLLASHFPALARRMPRPGAWMQTLRQLLAFPMIATVLWLGWVLAQQTSIDALIALLAVLLALSLLVWGWQRVQGARLRWLALLALLLPLGLTSAWFASSLEAASTPTPAASANSSGPWAPWTPERLNAELAAGRTVFVDFTAAWCVTCQVNKRSTFADAKVMRAFETKNVITLRADWTRRDPAITEALARLGRQGVPVYVFYRPGQPPTLLSELLSPADVLGALEKF
jgi:thiol:disulfide interchange protein DsbD